MPFSLLAQKLRSLHRDILKLAHERLLEKEDLSFGEILISFFGCRPKKIGLHWVQKFSKNQVLDICRLEPHEEFHFADKAERHKYQLDQTSASQAVAELVDRGLLATVKVEKLVWAKDQPRAERIESFLMIRLTEKGEKCVTAKRPESINELQLPLPGQPDTRAADPIVSSQSQWGEMKPS